MSTAVLAGPKRFDLEDLRVCNCYKPVLSTTLIVAADAISIATALFGAVAVASVWSGKPVLSDYRSLFPVVPLVLFLYWLSGLYPGIGASAVEELKDMSSAVSEAFLCLLVFFLLRGGSPRSFPWLAISSAWLGMIIVGPVVRAMTRNVSSKSEWWGCPVVVFGTGNTAFSVLRKLRQHPEIGLRPVAVVTDQQQGSHDGLTVCPSEYVDRMISFGVHHALIAAPELPHQQLVELIRRQRDIFPHLIIIPGIGGICNVSSQAHDVMGVFTLQVRNNLLHRGSQIAKRIIDLALCLTFGIFLLPFMILISLAIVVDSDGDILYSQTRIGHNGRTFKIWKFRTMVDDAPTVLQECLDRDPELRREWQETHKLRKDPRITRVGRLLRKTSLDELPQLWNVVRGEMSFVGPRPIVQAEIAKYEESYWVYAKVTPGLTGLWQVSGRNQTTYEERVAYDTYYVQNWSVWMDVYLLAKTIGVVLTGYGAY